MGTSYLIRVYDNFLPDAFADKICDLHTIGNFGWIYSPSTVLFRGSPTENLELNYKRVSSGVTTVYNMRYTPKHPWTIYNKHTIDTPQLTHSACHNGETTSIHFDQLSEIIKYLDFENVNYHIYRIKSNLTLNLTDYKKINHHPIHVDNETEDYKSLLYYVNDSDGDTLFFDNDLNIIKRVSPKKNTAILFDSNILHAGSNPIKSSKRIVINTIFKMEKI